MTFRTIVLTSFLISSIATLAISYLGNTASLLPGQIGVQQGNSSSSGQIPLTKGKLVIKKDARVIKSSDSKVAEFKYFIKGPDLFTLDIKTDSNGKGEASRDKIKAGEYTIVEKVQTKGWYSFNVSCGKDYQKGNSITIKVLAGRTITCTFVNYNT